MSVRIFHTMQDYVEHIKSIEKTNVPTLVASSYLASHLFSKNILIRYFNYESEEVNQARQIADQLWQRRKYIHSTIKTSLYNEIYEMKMFEEFCKAGLVHSQFPRFRATPKEIIEVLNNMLYMLNRFPFYNIGFCQEVLPFVFIIKTSLSVTIDVRNNFVYQQIQGLLMDEPAAVEEFQSEFWRIWNEPSTIMERQIVINLIEKRLEQVRDN